MFNHSFMSCSRQLLTLSLISLILISCVTINIYFPAAEAEKVAEQIIDEVLHSSENPPVINKEDQSQLYLNNGLETHYLQHSFLAIIDFMITSAHAAQANLSINSSKIRSIRSSMKKRQSKLQAYYKSGTIGFTNNGMIATVTSKGLSVKQKSTAKKLIAAENNDRHALYAEISNANGHPEWQADIQKTFSKAWINKISSGWMYQTQSGQWRKK